MRARRSDANRSERRAFLCAPCRRYNTSCAGNDRSAPVKAHPPSAHPKRIPRRKDVARNQMNATDATFPRKQTRRAPDNSDARLQGRVVLRQAFDDAPYAPAPSASRAATMALPVTRPEPAFGDRSLPLSGVVEPQQYTFAIGLPWLSTIWLSVAIFRPPWVL